MRFSITLATLLCVTSAGAQPELGTGAQGVESRADQRAQSEAAPQQPPTGPHGGQVRRVGSVRVETILSPGALRVFAYDAQGQPLDLRAARGVATLRVEGKAKRYRHDLFPEIGRNGAADSLVATLDLSRLAGAGVTVDVQLIGTQRAQRRPLRFTVDATAPMTDEQRISAAITKQGICPVSGQPLGSMGEPVPVRLGDRTVYVCCAGCTDSLQANPAKYLAKLPGAKKPQVSKSTEADAPFVAAQKVCPVMDEPLGAMGGPYKTVVQGRVVYLCCPGCAKKLHAKPAEYLAKLSEWGVNPPVVK